MSRTDPQLKVRLPLEMKDELEKAAKENHRSMNAEIVSRLAQSLGYAGPATDGGEQEELDDDANKAIKELDEAVERYLRTRDLRNRLAHGKDGE